MTEIKGQYKLYELSDRLTEIEECLEKVSTSNN